MLLWDTRTGYGLVTRLLHWLMAIAILAMFGLGLWMVQLDYYSPHYNSAPYLHRGAGIILALALVFRFGWRLINVKPDDGELSPFEQKASRLVHWGFYPVLLVLVASGYLISTPDGRPIDVFGLFNVPSLVQEKGLEDAAGLVHRWIAYFTMALVALHMGGAIKHHMSGQHHVMARMWRGPPPK